MASQWPIISIPGKKGRMLACLQPCRVVVRILPTVTVYHIQHMVLWTSRLVVLIIMLVQIRFEWRCYCATVRA